MTMHVKDAGAWKEVAQPSVRDGGAWKAVQEGWVKDSGSWKQFYTAETVALTDTDVLEFTIGGTATAGIIFGSDGQLSERQGGSVTDTTGEWLDPVGDGSDYQVRATKTAGSDPTSGPALGTWHPLSTTREWRNDRSTDGNTSSTLLCEIRKGTGSVLDSASIKITADRSSL